MRPPRIPLYDRGQPVRAGVDLFNDGSYPDQPAEVLLVASGSPGEVAQVGMHEEGNIPVYMVEFADGKVVGCFEEEIEVRRP